MSIYFHLFNIIPGMTYDNFRRIFQSFPNLKYAYAKTTRSEFLEIGIKDHLADNIIAARKKIFPTKEEEFLTKSSLKFLTLEDPNYPSLLKNIPDPPFLLYVKGDLLPSDSFSLAIVGTRTPSYYSEQILRHFMESFAFFGITIVSGMAYGVDSMAHSYALENGLRTVAVLGHGLDQIYPFSHKNLSEKICKNGALLSEFPPGCPPKKEHFPRRNRIISGLTLATLVVEAKERSGSLITAYHALNQGRDVFAIPGNIFHNLGLGTNMLIQKSEAQLAFHAHDILQAIQTSSLIPLFQSKNKKQIQNSSYTSLNENETSILNQLRGSPLNIDTLSHHLQKPPQDILETLSVLEIKGCIRGMGGGYYTIS